MKSTAHICCILPPHILYKLSEHPEHRQRALRALAITERLRGRREVFAQFAAGLSAGQKRRTIYDAQHQTDLPGTLMRGEGDDKSSLDVAINEAYDFSGATYDFYQNAYNRNSVDGRGLRLDSTPGTASRYRHFRPKSSLRLTRSLRARGCYPGLQCRNIGGGTPI